MKLTTLLVFVLHFVLLTFAQNCGIVSISQALRTQWSETNSDGTLNYYLYDITISNNGLTTLTSAQIPIHLDYSFSYIEEAWGMNQVDGRDTIVFSLSKDITIAAGATYSGIGYILVNGETEISIVPTCYPASTTTSGSSTTTSTSTTIGTSTTTTSTSGSTGSSNVFDCTASAIMSFDSEYIEHAPYPYPKKNTITIHNNFANGNLTYVVISVSTPDNAEVTATAYLVKISDPNTYSLSGQDGTGLINVPLYGSVGASYISIGDTTAVVIQAQCTALAQY